MEGERERRDGNFRTRPPPSASSAPVPPPPIRQVLNGPLFKAQFSLLRYKRGKRRQTAADRPFAAMHEHFVLVRPRTRARSRVARARRRTHARAD